MRTLKISLLVFILSITISAQWYQQNSGTTNTLMGVSFTDQNNGTVVGEYGTILRTTDGGINWITQTFDTTEWFNDVCFTDANTGTVVSATGHIFRTTDGGTTWTLQTSPSSCFWSVCFTDANNGTAVGSQGKIVRTTNGGTTWTLQTSGTTVWLNRVSFTDPDNGTAVGDYGTILRTTNSGMNWINQSLGIWDALWGVSFTDANTGTIVGAEGIILRTTNGGANWVSQTSGIMSYFYGGVSFTDTNNGTAVGDNGAIVRTTDGGTTWTLQTSGTTSTLFGVSFTDANNGTTVGENGTILRTTNGGGIPVELFSFTASILQNEKAVQLKWSTATETNNQGFEINKKESGDRSQESEWMKIGFAPGHGTTTETQHYSFSDNDVKPGKYQYKLKQIDYDGTFEYSQIVEVEIPFVNEFSLSQNYPNPFNPATSMQYTISSRQFVSLKVYDLLGREIATLVNEEKPAGDYEVEFSIHSDEGRNLSSGIYFYQLQAGNYIETKKMVLMK